MINLRILLVFSCFTLATLYSKGQTARNCGTMEHLEHLKQQDPGLVSRMDEVEQRMQQYISNNRTAAVPLVIRVVVHVVWNSPVQNISNAQVLSQIDVLNEDYSRTNADTGNTPPVFLPVAASPRYSFLHGNRRSVWKSN